MQIDRLLMLSPSRTRGMGLVRSVYSDAVERVAEWTSRAWGLDVVQRDVPSPLSRAIAELSSGGPRGERLLVAQPHEAEAILLYGNRRDAPDLAGPLRAAIRGASDGLAVQASVLDEPGDEGYSYELWVSEHTQIPGAMANAYSMLRRSISSSRSRHERLKLVEEGDPLPWEPADLRGASVNILDELVSPLFPTLHQLGPDPEVTYALIAQA